MNTQTSIAVAALSLLMSACPEVAPRAEPCNGNLDCSDQEICLNGYCEANNTSPVDAGLTSEDVEVVAEDVVVTGPDAGPVDVAPRPDVLNEVPFVDAYSGSRVAVRVDYDGPAIADFPLLVRVDKTLPAFEGFVPEQMSVSDQDGNSIPFELSEDLENETLIYVKVELSSDLLFFIYFNSPANALEDPASVWSDNYVAVFHMEDDEDSAPNSRGAGVYGPVERLQGPLGSALDLAAADDVGLWLGRGRAGVAGATGATACQWLYGGEVGGGVMAFSIGGNNPTTLSRFSLQTTSNGIQTIVRDSDQGVSTNLRSIFDFPDEGTMVWVCSIVDLATGTIQHYANNELIDVTDPAFTSGTFPEDPSYTAAIGAEDDARSDFLDGTVDEVLVSNVVRDSAYLSAQYASMQTPFIVFGERENQFTEEPPSEELALGGIELAFDEDEAQVINVLEGSNVTRVLSVGSAELGNAVRTSDHQIAYWPRPNIFGEDSFTFVAGNGLDQSESVSVSLSIQSVNDSPVLANRELTLVAGATLETSFQASDVDNDLDDLEYQISGLPDEGVMTLIGNTVTYTAGETPGVYDGFVRVDDNAGGADIARFRYTVTEAPVVP